MEATPAVNPKKPNAAASYRSVPAGGVSRARRAASLLEANYDRYHRPPFIGNDPLSWARAYERPADREIAAFLAATLAYGNVKQIDRSLRGLFGRVGRSPAAFARDFVPGRSDRKLDGFYHRFNAERDFCALFHLLGQMVRGWGSLEAFWADAQAGGGRGDIAERAGRFMDAALALDPGPYGDAIGLPPRLPFLYLMPRAGGASACKRFFLFLRWVVRPDDGVDLGLWRVERPAELEYPVDTHILRIAKYLGATRRKSADARARREITRFFRRVDPDDPVRFDFSLCRLGILRLCPTRRDLELCGQCALQPACLRYRRMSRRIESLSG